MDTKDIVLTVREIRKAAADDMTPEDIRTQFSAFAERYPHLFVMTLEPTFDWDKFAYIISMKAKIDTSQTTVEDASKEVGQKMFDHYVKPKVDANKKK